MAEMLRECGLPEGVFAVATGDGSTGAALIAQVDCVMFTGSTRTGKAVMKAAAERLIPCYLELGGKDPMIVCADADVERAANAASYYSMNNAGQVCISVERCYVEEPVYDEFVAKVTETVRGLRQGASTEPGSVDVGAVIFPPQLDIVEAHVRDAVDKGAKVLTGGHGHAERGRFYEPTVLVDVDHTMTIMREETFGPTLPIMKVASVEEGIRLANDSDYGLQASVWTKDVERGEQLARRIQAGSVCVNDAQINYLALNLPMGGWKSSGIGTRHGAGGIRKYCKTQSVLVTRFGPKRDPWMFPYKRRSTLAAAPAVQGAVRPRQPGLTAGADRAARGQSLCGYLVTERNRHRQRLGAHEVHAVGGRAGQLRLPGRTLPGAGAAGDGERAVVALGTELVVAGARLAAARRGQGVLPGQRAALEPLRVRRGHVAGVVGRERVGLDPATHRAGALGGAGLRAAAGAGHDRGDLGGGLQDERELAAHLGRHRLGLGSRLDLRRLRARSRRLGRGGGRNSSGE